MNSTEPARPPRAIWAVYSLAERDRRWQRVRENAAQAGFDCILVPLGNGLDARYLTQLSVAGVALPTDPRPPIVITDPLRDRKAFNDWVPEPRFIRSGTWGQAMAQALLDLGMERARIGVVGLRSGTVTHVRAADGVVNHVSYQAVLQRMPRAAFEDATDVVGLARYVKSDEEMQFLRQSTAIAEAGVDVMVESAHPDADLADVYARVMGRLFELGSEHRPLALSADPIGTSQPARYMNPPLGKRLEPNTMIVGEVSAVWGGQVAQAVQPILLGKMPDEWKPVIDLHRELFQDGLQYMRPGVPLAELVNFVNRYGEKRGLKTAIYRGLKTAIYMEGCGLGDDGPLLTPDTKPEGVPPVTIEKGTAWVWRPSAMGRDRRIQLSWGGVVVVTETGPEALLTRPHGLVSVT